MIVAEPTRCVPICGHRGLCRFELHVHGRAAHTAQPEQGDNAIVAAAQLVLALDGEHARLQAAPPPGQLGRPALTVSMIEGGSGINVVPELCKVSVDRRVVDGERPAEIRDALFALAQKACRLPVTLHPLREIEAFLQPPTTPWVQQLTEWAGCAVEFASFGTNAWAFHDLPGDCVVIGPGSIAQAHGAEEWVEIEQLQKMAHIYARWWDVEL
jgi:acetylornithine deacetylase